MRQVAQDCQDLTSKQQTELLQVLTKHKSLFAGKHGEWKGTPITISLFKGAKPFWAKPYPIPLKKCEVFKEELNWQGRIGAPHELTAEIEDKEWASSAVGIPKKNGMIRLMISFRRINQCLKLKEYPLPTIEQILQDISVSPWPQ